MHTLIPTIPKPRRRPSSRRVSCHQLARGVSVWVPHFLVSDGARTTAFWTSKHGCRFAMVRVSSASADGVDPGRGMGEVWESAIIPIDPLAGRSRCSVAGARTQNSRRRGADGKTPMTSPSCPEEAPSATDAIYQLSAGESDQDRACQGRGRAQRGTGRRRGARRTIRDHSHSRNPDGPEGEPHTGGWARRGLSWAPPATEPDDG
jgi:hypothetical protein